MYIFCITFAVRHKRRRLAEGSNVPLELTHNANTNDLQCISSGEDDFSDASSDDFGSDEHSSEEEVMPGIFPLSRSQYSVLQASVLEQSEYSSSPQPSQPSESDHPPWPSLWQNTSPNIFPLPFKSKRELKQLPNGSTPYDFFRLLFTDEFIDEIVLETNTYAQYILTMNASPKGRIKQWKELTREEFLVFLGLTFHTGTIKISRLAAYWSTKDTRRGLLNIPCFGEIMKRDRYLLILQCLHFAENPTNFHLIPMDRLYKCRRIINYFNEKMDSVFSPGRELSINESIILWRGKLQCRKNKYGMKLYVLAETDGLAMKLILYAGATDNVGGVGHADRVVHSLIEGRTGIGHAVYADNFYNSVRLTRDLLDNQTYITGTLRKTRLDNPKSVTHAVLKRHEMVQQFTSDGICVMKWRDKRDILMISSESTGDLVDVRNSKGEIYRKPLMVKTYNEQTSRIDRVDQLLAYYPCERKMLKWYKKLAIHIFQIVLVNSHILYNTYTVGIGMKKPLYDFRLDVIEKLVNIDYPNRPTQYPALPINPIHYPAVSGASTSAPRKHKRKTCRQCKKTTKYFCNGCQPDHRGQIGLCPECFQGYHQSFVIDSALFKETLPS